jgi:superfamily II DNA/RNA helicase
LSPTGCSGDSGSRLCLTNADSGSGDSAGTTGARRRRLGADRHWKDCCFLSISHVINYDMPHTIDAYTHRVGRTGRAEKTGDALSFITHEDEGVVRSIERVLGEKVERRRMKGFDYDRAEPSRDPKFPLSRPGKRTDAAISEARSVSAASGKKRQIGKAAAEESGSSEIHNSSHRGTLPRSSTDLKQKLLRFRTNKGRQQAGR